jgi:hypothetical protein
MYGGDNEYGIISQAVHDVFLEIDTQRIAQQPPKIKLECSMYEIYKESICDLMGENEKEIKIKENVYGNIEM